MEKETELLKIWRKKINEYIETVSNYMTKCSPISKEYCKSKEDIQKDVFNIFFLVSDLYYRENFHSDIISFFLDTQEKHGAGNAFLDVFIQMLNKKGKSIDSNYYRDAVAIREKEDRIDILIKSESTKRAIIIENKINNAGDMERQIPRYYDHVTQNYILDAIVYLPLDSNKEPYKGDWTDEDKKKVNPFLLIIPAYDKSGKINLVDDWLHPSILLSDNLDVASTLRQYSILITKLNHNIMSTIVLEKFYNELIQGDNFKTALSIRDMLYELPGYLGTRIKDKFENRCSPFEAVYANPKGAVFHETVIRGILVKIDVFCTVDGYDVVFWSPDENQNESEFIQLVQVIGALKEYCRRANTIRQFIKHFQFTDEKGLFNSLEEIMKELNSISKE